MKIIKFCKVESYDTYDNKIKDKIKVGYKTSPHLDWKQREVHYNLYLGVLIETTKDFNINSDEVEMVADTSSYQIRPKIIYKNKTGYFVNIKPRVYLDKNEVEKIIKKEVK